MPWSPDNITIGEFEDLIPQPLPRVTHYGPPAAWLHAPATPTADVHAAPLSAPTATSPLHGNGEGLGVRLYPLALPATPMIPPPPANGITVGIISTRRDTTDVPRRLPTAVPHCQVGVSPAIVDSNIGVGNYSPCNKHQSKYVSNLITSHVNQRDGRMSQMPGQRLGSYELIEMIGSGGMASVYRARQASLQREVAVKLIRIEDHARDDFMRRFEREGRVLSGLNHAHIVKTYEFGKHENQAFLAMELLTGGSLANHIMYHAPLPPAEIEQYLSQIAAALTYAHKQNIVHRDLKPSNVLFNAQRAAILTDFGVAKVIHETTTLTKTGMIVGTPPYMAPEQWRGEQVDARVDIYALGILLFEMVTGRLPFWATEPVNLMYLHMQQAPPSVRQHVPTAPEQLDWVITKALAKNRASRFATADDLLAAFRAVVKSSSWAADTPVDPASAKTKVSQRTVPFQQINLAVTTVGDNEGAILEDNTDQATALGVTPELREEQEQHALRQLAIEMRDQTQSTQTRTVNIPPIDTSVRFIGRAREISDIMRLIEERARLVSVYGRGGVGKTALVCRALSQSLGLAESGIDGVVYLSFVSTGISLDRIFADVAKLLPEASADELQGIRVNPHISAAQKTSGMLDLLGERRLLLLLDNIESIQHPETGVLTDADLQAFIETVVKQSTALTLLVTSRVPLALPLELKPQERLVPLEEGLPSEDGVAFLRTNDPDGVAGLRDAQEQKLAALVEKVRGFPRALEAIIGRLLDDQLLTVDDLLDSMSDNRDGPAVRDDITPLIVKQAIDHLSPDALRVMECLAVYEYPVSIAAVEFMLAPYMQTGNLRALLNRLIRTYFVGFNKAAASFSVHSIDRAYCIDRLVSLAEPTAIEAPSYTYRALNLRAADFCVRQRKPEDSLGAVEDLTPQLNEFEYRLRAADYDQAAGVLLDIDFNYLMLWGQFERVVKMHQHLRDRPLSPALQQRSLANLGTAISYTGDIEAAVRYHDMALVIARQMGDRAAEAHRLRNLGQLYIDLGQLERSKTLAEQAIEIASAIHDERGVGVGYNVLGLALERLSEVIPASEAYEKSIDHLQRAGEKRFSAAVRGNLANLYLSLGKFEQALKYYLETEAAMREMNDLQNLAVLLSNLGRVYNNLGQIAKGVPVLEESITLFGQTGSPDGAALAKGYLAVTYMQVGNYQQALDHAYEARKILGDLPMPRIATYVQGLIVTALVQLNEIERAHQELAKITWNEDSDLEYEILAWRAVLALRRGQPAEAAQFAEQSIQMAKEMLTTMPDQYDVLYTRALMYAAQALLTKTAPTAASDGYKKALAACSAVGVVISYRLMLDALMQAPDGERLAEVRSLLQRAVDQQA
ncbi:MAG: protein kinase [Anaerolineae bacterium]|nr:protein kinase [Anaerolineae bacterium]